MRNLYVVLALLLVTQPMKLWAQTSVSAGAGSYASFPPASENQDDWDKDGKGDLYPFVFDRPIYVANNKKGQGIPTNDWWTDLVVSGKNAGLLWAYPLVADPEPTGFKAYFPNSFVTDGSNMALGGYMQISAAGYTPTTALAKDWSDWGLTMSIPDSANNKNIEVTMAHGIPFMWVETKGINPEFSFERGASYLTASGSALTLPTSNSFVIQTDGRYIGIHLDGNSTAELQGQQYALIDLGSVQPITKVKLNWEAAYASGYAIQISSDKQNWATPFATTTGDGGLDSISLNTNGRYVKIALSQRGSPWAYSLLEMEVFNNTTLLSKNKAVEVSSTQQPFVAAGLNDGNTGTRWASDGNQTEKLVLNTNNGNSFFVISALPTPATLTTFEQYAFNKVVKTEVGYSYNATGGKVQSQWNITTANLKGQVAGNTLQGFLPHLYQNAANSISFTGYNYVTSRGTMKTAAGNTFTFSYDFSGILPNYNAPFADTSKAHPYKSSVMYDLLTQFSKKTDYGADTYWGGKDLVNFAKYTLMAKELNHQAFAALKVKTREALVNWLTYTPGETEKFFARYDRWGALVGFNESYGSSQFTDNHFHYGYLVLACALYGMVDQDFLNQYGPMIKLVAKQYANWDKTDTSLPWMRTFDPWIGHSYAGGTSSSTGNNQESTSEAMQSWIGLFLAGDLLNEPAMRDAGAFGYSSESFATLEYWFDWKKRNLPPAYGHSVVGILSNQGFAYGTYFSASPMHIHAIQYLPVNPGFRYLARDTAWAHREYNNMMAETRAVDGNNSEVDFGDDWAHVALGFRQLWDPGYTAAYMEENLKLPKNDTNYIMDYDVSGMTYYYTHANQNLGTFSNAYHTNFPSSSVFEANGIFSHAVAYNPAGTAKTCTVYDAFGATVASFSVPAYTLVTYPALGTNGQQPNGCYGLLPLTATATTGNASTAIDGNPGTRWESKFEDPQSLTVDLGVVSTVNKVTISWEVANAKEYYLLGATDTLHWDTIRHQTNMGLGNRIDTINGLNVHYRYLRMAGKVRNTPYGYSIYEFEVCGTATNDTTETPQRVNIHIEAEQYSAQSGIQTEVTTDTGGGLNVGWIEAGDWMDYTVNIPQAGDYLLSYRIASPYTGTQVQLMSGNSVLATTDIPQTGGWQNWTTVTTTAHFATAGVQTIRLYAVTNGFNVNWLEIQNTANVKMASAAKMVAKDGKVVLYPNPANYQVNLQVSEKARFYITDLQGKVIRSGLATPGTNVISLHGLTQGFYFIRVNNQAIKLVVSH